MTIRLRANVLISKNESNFIRNKISNRHTDMKIQSNFMNHTVANWPIEVKYIRCCNLYLHLNWCGNIWLDRFFRKLAVNDEQFLKYYYSLGCHLNWQINFELHCQIDSWWLIKFLHFFVFFFSITHKMRREIFSFSRTRLFALAATVKCAKFKHMQFISPIHINWLTQHTTILFRIK